MEQKLQNKVAIVTGATSGMGAEIAKLFASHGAKVVVNGRNVKRGNQIVKDILDAQGEAVFIKSDISTKKGNEYLFQETLKEFGVIDIASLNAGMLGLGSITTVEPEIWHKTIETNLYSVYYLLKLVIPEMQKRKFGNIIITGSIAANKAFPNHPAYCASKGALVPLVKQIALDYAPYIRANLINPGPVDTPMIWDSAKAFPNPGQAVEDAGKTTLVGRLGKPEDIANAALFLASEDSSFMTGTTITLDGGISAKG